MTWLRRVSIGVIVVALIGVGFCAGAAVFSGGDDEPVTYIKKHRPQTGLEYEPEVLHV